MRKSILLLPKYVFLLHLNFYCKKRVCVFSLKCFYCYKMQGILDNNKGPMNNTHIFRLFGKFSKILKSLNFFNSFYIRTNIVIMKNDIKLLILLRKRNTKCE